MCRSDSGGGDWDRFFVSADFGIWVDEGELKIGRHKALPFPARGFGDEAGTQELVFSLNLFKFGGEPLHFQPEMGGMRGMRPAAGVSGNSSDGKPGFCFPVFFLHVRFAEPAVGGGEVAGVAGEFFMYGNPP